MQKYRYIISGISPEGENITGSCVDTDIISAIQLFRVRGFNITSAKQAEQLPERVSAHVIEKVRYPDHLTIP